MRPSFVANIHKMSAVSTSRPKKVDPLSKRVPENPKYKHVKSTLDTGSSITKYMEKLEEQRAYYKHTKEELFRRMKVTTFVQLIVQVAEYESSTMSIDNGSERPDTADQEVYDIQRGGGDPSPARAQTVSEADYRGQANDTNRSTLQKVISGEGELDKANAGGLVKKVLDGCPYLLLDVRELDHYNSCHITTAKSYPTAMLSRATNYETKDMLTFRNQPGKIIIVYDENETLAPNAANTLVQRGYDNLFMLSGGMKVAYKIFPEGLMTGTPSQTVLDSARAPSVMEQASKDNFSMEDISTIEMYLDNALTDKSSGNIHVMEEIISFCEFHKIEMQFGIPCAENLFDNILKRNTMSRSSFVWAKPLGVAPSMMWPVKVVKLPLVYCNCDNAWLRLKEIEKIELFRINDIEKWRSAAQSRLSKASTTASRMSNYSNATRSTIKGPPSQASGRVSHQQPFK